MKNKVILIVSIVIGAAAFLVTSRYLQLKHRQLAELRESIYAGARKIPVVAASRNIPKGSVITRDDIGKKEIFEVTAPDRVISTDKASMLLGRKTVFEVSADKPILWSDIEGGALSDMGLSPIVKPGMRAISLSLGGAATVSGMVQPGDRVDVLGTFLMPSPSTPGEMETATLTVLQDVSVLATGRQLAKHQYLDYRGRSSSGYSTVTLEVTPREAELLVFAEHTKGQLTLSLRNPSDVSFESDLPEINFQHIENELPALNLHRQKYIRHKKQL